MESLGEIGRIQVEERTARLLMECLCTESKFCKGANCTCQGRFPHHLVSSTYQTTNTLTYTREPAYLIERRGPIDVKGKGTMVTYFVDKRDQQPVNAQQQPQLLQLQQSQQVVAVESSSSSAQVVSKDEPERVAK